MRARASGPFPPRVRALGVTHPLGSREPTPIALDLQVG